MRYITLLLFAGFLVFCVDFATQNNNQVILSYKQELFHIVFSTEHPVFVPIIFSFALGIIFSVFYFFIYHANLLRKLSLRKKEIKKLEGLLKTEKEKKEPIIQTNSDLQQSSKHVQSNLDYDENREKFLLEDEETKSLNKAIS